MGFSEMPTLVGADQLTETRYDTYIRDNMNAGIFRPVASVLLTATTAEIAFSGISPDDFAFWRIIANARSTVAAVQDNWYLRFNGDPGSNYWYERLYGNGGTPNAAGSGAADTELIGLNVPGNTAPSAGFGFAVIDFSSLKAGRHRRVYYRASSRKGTATGDHYVGIGAGYWINADDDVTSISFRLNSGSFAAGTRFDLYGAGGIA